MPEESWLKTDGSMWYDPPEGWRHGFPRPYKPLPGESIEDTLRRDGYPEHLLQYAKHTRFGGG